MDGTLFQSHDHHYQRSGADYSSNHKPLENVQLKLKERNKYIVFKIQCLTLLQKFMTLLKINQTRYHEIQKQKKVKLLPADMLETEQIFPNEELNSRKEQEESES